MMLVILAIVAYAIAVLAGGLGFSGLARGASPFMRYLFGGALALTFVLIVAAGIAARHAI
jgi:uncharacterized membrane protein YtjA (UPF0391 family)